MNIKEYLLNQLGVNNFDVTDVDFFICDHPINDFTSISLVPNQKRKTEQGIDASYHTYVTLPSYCTISVSLLPECADVHFMEGLQKFHNTKKGWFEVILKYNGRFIGIYDCYLTTDSADSITADGADKVYEMVAVKKADSNIMQGFEDLGSIG